MERLTRAGEIIAAAHRLLQSSPGDGRANTHRSATGVLLALAPAATKLGAAIVAAVARRPGGVAQLDRVSRDVEKTIRELSNFPDSQRVANLPDGGRLV